MLLVLCGKFAKSLLLEDSLSQAVPMNLFLTVERSSCDLYEYEEDDEDDDEDEDESGQSLVTSAFVFSRSFSLPVFL